MPEYRRPLKGRKCHEMRPDSVYTWCGISGYFCYAGGPTHRAVKSGDGLVYACNGGAIRPSHPIERNPGPATCERCVGQGSGPKPGDRILLRKMPGEVLEVEGPWARVKLAAAERQIKRYRNPQPRLEALRIGYAALEKGQELIELGPTIGAGGWDEDGRPRLAVARSDREGVRMSFSNNLVYPSGRATVRFSTWNSDITRRGWDHNGNPGPTRRSVSMRYFPEYEWDHNGNPGPTRRSVSMRYFPEYEWDRTANSALAVVPIVPPDVMETAGNPALKKCFTLFEADWEDVPVDPALLRHIGGDLYAVLATWNLTSLEQAILREFSAER